MGITAQAVDGVHGRSAAGLHAWLEHRGHSDWQRVGEVQTDSNGRINGWATQCLERGLYRLVFDSDRYFSGLGMTSVYPEITITFRVQSGSTPCRIQIVLAPHTYTTYFNASS